MMAMTTSNSTNVNATRLSPDIESLPRNAVPYGNGGLGNIATDASPTVRIGTDPNAMRD